MKVEIELREVRDGFSTFLDRAVVDTENGRDMANLTGWLKSWAEAAVPRNDRLEAWIKPRA